MPPDDYALELTGNEAQKNIGSLTARLILHAWGHNLHLHEGMSDQNPDNAILLNYLMLLIFDTKLLSGSVAPPPQLSQDLRIDVDHVHLNPLPVVRGRAFEVLASPHDPKSTLVVIDMKGMGDINQKWGMEGGNYIIRSLLWEIYFQLYKIHEDKSGNSGSIEPKGNIFNILFEKGYYIARLGGDEFVVKGSNGLNRNHIHSALQRTSEIMGGFPVAINYKQAPAIPAMSAIETPDQDLMEKLEELESLSPFSKLGLNLIKALVPSQPKLALRLYELAFNVAIRREVYDSTRSFNITPYNELLSFLMSICLESSYNPTGVSHILAVDQVGALKRMNSVSQYDGDKYLRFLAEKVSKIIYTVISENIRTYMYQRGGTVFVHLPPYVSSQAIGAIEDLLGKKLPSFYIIEEKAIPLISTFSIQKWSSPGEHLGIRDLDRLTNMFEDINLQANIIHNQQFLSWILRIPPENKTAIRLLGELYNPYGDSRANKRLGDLGIFPEDIMPFYVDNGYAGRGVLTITYQDDGRGFLANAALPGQGGTGEVVEHQVLEYSLKPKFYEKFMSLLQNRIRLTLNS